MYRMFFKRAIDLVLSIIVLPIWFAILVVIGPIIYLQDKGPIFYNAPRLGKGGRVFTMYKFRSMRVNAPDVRNEDGSTYNAADDPRLTRIGRFIRKTSLDETPQVLNIIKGDMSFIGPRPDLPEHRTLYQGNEGRKLEVMPGITGYNQAYFRNAIPWKERIQNDIYYIDNLSWWLDARIFFRTVAAVLRREDIYLNETSSNSRKRSIV